MQFRSNFSGITEISQGNLGVSLSIAVRRRVKFMNNAGLPYKVKIMKDAGLSNNLIKIWAYSSHLEWPHHTYIVEDKILFVHLIRLEIQLVHAVSYIDWVQISKPSTHTHHLSKICSQREINIS